jgi:hypothetical protein
MNCTLENTDYLYSVNIIIYSIIVGTIFNTFYLCMTNKKINYLIKDIKPPTYSTA